MLKVRLRLYCQLEADNEVLERFNKLKYVLVVKLGVIGKLDELFNDLVGEASEFTLRKVSKITFTALFIKVLHKNALNSQFSSINRILKILNIFAE